VSNVIVTMSTDMAEWLSTHIKGGIRRYDKEMRNLVVALLEMAPTVTEARVASTKREKADYIPKAGSGMHRTLEVFGSFENGLTSTEAADLLSEMRRPTTIANVHNLLEKKLLKVVGIKDGDVRRVNVYAITKAGRRALAANKKEAGK